MNDSVTVYEFQLSFYSVITLSSHTIVPSALVENDVSIATAALHLNRSSFLSMHVICEVQLIITFIPELNLWPYRSKKEIKRES